MPVKLLGTVVLLIVVTILCGFNLGDEYRCNVNLLFHIFENVPVFFTVLIYFFAGVLIMTPFTFGNAKHKAAMKELAEKVRQEKIAAKEQAKADVQAKKDAIAAEKEAKKAAERAEKERKEQEKLAKKQKKTQSSKKLVSASTAAVNPANEVPVIKSEPVSEI